MMTKTGVRHAMVIKMSPGGSGCARFSPICARWGSAETPAFDCWMMLVSCIHRCFVDCSPARRFQSHSYRPRKYSRGKDVPDVRLIERWLPIAALGVESVRERTRSMTPFPATDYRLHVWWARRPLVASRAAVLASLLPADVDHDKFLHVLGIHGDPVATRRKMRLTERKRTRQYLVT